MNRIRLHKNYRTRIFNRKKFTFLILSFFVFGIILTIDFLGHRIEKQFYEISSIEATKLSKAIVVESINNIILENFDSNDLFVIEKDNKGIIQSVDFNTNKINNIQLLINKNIKKYLEELENGKSSIINLKKNIITNSVISNKKGVFLEIPIGMFFNNIFFSNFGPKIPVKLSLNGEVISTINTSAEAYGINNTLLRISIKVNVSEQIILPRLSKNIIIENEIPLALKMISGEVPNYYMGNLIKNK